MAEATFAAQRLATVSMRAHAPRTALMQAGTIRDPSGKHRRAILTCSVTAEETVAIK